MNTVPPTIDTDETDPSEAIPEIDAASSSMPQEARRALVYLLKQGAVLEQHKPHIFTSICRYEEPIRAHLSEVYLQLILERKAGVAFISTQQEDSDEESTENGADEGLSLIHKQTLSIYDTLVLLILRKHYQERETLGEQKVIIDGERIEASLTPFLSLTNSDKNDRKKLLATLNKLIPKKIISAVRGDDNRYEITPIIRFVVSAEVMASMLAEYQRIAREKDIPLSYTPLLAPTPTTSV